MTFDGDLGFGDPTGRSPEAANGSVDVDAIVQAVRERQVEQTKFEARGIDDLLAMADPEWLIYGIVPEQSFSVIFGPPGSGKSFLAIDFALCVAAGIPWFGRTIKRKSVVYVAGEGVAGLKRRVEAWLEAHPGADPRGWFFLVPEAPNLLDGEHALRLAATLGGVKQSTGETCGLLVIDTLARSMAGGDENSVKDVGLVIERLDQLSRPHAAMVLHHTQKASTAERGSSALRGAADLMVRVEPEKGDSTRFSIHCEKAKDAEPFDRIRLAMQPTASSISLVTDLTAEIGRDQKRKDELLDFLRHSPTAVTKRAMRNAVGGRGQSVDAALEGLISEGLAEKHGSLWRACPHPRDTPGHAGHTPSFNPPGSPSSDVSRQGAPRRGAPWDTAGDPAALWDDGNVSRVRDAGHLGGDDLLLDVDHADEGEVSW